MISLLIIFEVPRVGKASHQSFCAGHRGRQGRQRRASLRGGRMSEHNISGKKVAFLLTDGVEQVELTGPWNAVKEAGGEPTLVSPKSGTLQGYDGTDKGETFTVDLTVDQANADDFHALVIPGGVVNADHLRADKGAQAFARGFFEQHKPVASICHGPWLLIDAGVASGRSLTSYHTLQTDLRNAGAN